ncbi:MAG: hypothetical protein GWN39_15095 [Thermoplasmata archaeon]|nr:hypothetical protein [Thermoplasmata archaeon]NIV80026.1 hypothetical protein [Thermoplasmata archaeon]NIW90104.1 hypothetical protein [Thermoplasmata archaeon]
MVFVAPMQAIAQEDNPQPPPSDGDLPGVLDAREKVILLAVSLWVFLQVPVALLMRMWANEMGANGNIWLVMGAIPLLGYMAWPAFQWMRNHRSRSVGRVTSHPSRDRERSGS